jgi:hypothetical protein
MQQQALKPVSFLAVGLLVAAAAFTAQNAHACGTQRDFLVRADPLLANVRPADCATLLDVPAEFTWPTQPGAGSYMVSLSFPDGHTESRVTRSNWLAWGPLPAGEYTWRVSVAGGKGARSDARGFRVEVPAKQPETMARERQAPRPTGEARDSAPAANLFRLVPSESWIPSAASPGKPTRPAVGGFFGGFTE